MSTPEELLALQACGIPCPGCPVASLSEEARYAVDLVLQLHGPELPYDEAIYPWDDAKADSYVVPEEVLEWSADALAFGGCSTHEINVSMVGKAVTKIVNEGCPTYSEGEI